MKSTVENIFEKSGGQGWIHIERLLTPEELGPNVKMYARVEIDVHASIGVHQHQGDCESYYMLSGKASYVDNNNVTRILQPGDITFTEDKESHGIANIGSTPLVFMAMIIKR